MSKKQIYDVLIPEEYETSNGEVKTKFWQMGVAFKHEDGEGLNLIIAPGVSISGKAIIRPRLESRKDADE